MNTKNGNTKGLHVFCYGLDFHCISLGFKRANPTFIKLSNRVRSFSKSTAHFLRSILLAWPPLKVWGTIVEIFGWRQTGVYFCASPLSTYRAQSKTFSNTYIHILWMRKRTLGYNFELLFEATKRGTKTRSNLSLQKIQNVIDSLLPNDPTLLKKFTRFLWNERHSCHAYY